MKRTRFFASHKKSNGRMIEFFGWEMPVEYRGIIEEHLAVRKRAGLFDVSHMGEILIRGKDALALVQELTPNDASRLVPNQAQYTALTTSQGTFIDDLLVYCLGQEEYLLVVNAANADKDYAWIVAHQGGFDALVENASDRYSQLALQGPRAQEILQPLTDLSLSELKPFWAGRATVAGVSALISRTGYTGEDGFEIYTTSMRRRLSLKPTSSGSSSSKKAIFWGETFWRGSSPRGSRERSSDSSFGREAYRVPIIRYSFRGRKRARSPREHTLLF
jgi:aminomethyltransferase